MTILPHAAFRARYLDWQFSSAGAPGEIVDLRVTLENSSSLSWADDPEHPLNLSYHWLDAEENYVVFEGVRTKLLVPLSPGQRETVTLRVCLPAQPGRYLLAVSLLQEGVAWFHERGVPPLELGVTIPASRGTLDIVRLAPRWWRRMQRWLTEPLRDLFRYRYLIWPMAKRDLFGRFRASFAGVGWTVLQPLLLLLVYTVVFSFVLNVRFGPDNRPSNFLLYFLCGLIPWNLFSESVIRSATCVIENTNLVKRVVFPVQILPIQLLVSSLVGQAFGWALLILLIGIFRSTLPWTLAFFPLVLLPQLLLTLGLAWFIASLSVFVRDIPNLLGISLSLLFFLTPICYPATMIPPTLEPWFQLNPLLHLVEAYRSIFLLAKPPRVVPIFGLLVAGAAVFVAGHLWFRRTQRSFADVL